MGSLDNAKEHIASCVEDLRGDDDFMPFLITRRGEDIRFLGLAAMAEEVKADIADVMFSAIAVARAEEAVFASCSWMSLSKPSMDNVPPSLDPNRQEVVMIMHVTRDGDAMYTARLHRRDRRVLLGEWQQADIQGGRFANAIRGGMRIGAKLSAEVAQEFQKSIDDGEFAEVMAAAMTALSIFRAKAREEDRS